MTNNVVNLPGRRDPAREDLVEMFEGFLQLAREGELQSAIVAAHTVDGPWLHEYSANLNFREQLGGFLMLLLEIAGVAMAKLERHGYSR